MTTGRPEAGSVKTESFQLSTLKKCQALPDSPLAVDAAFGAFVNKQVLVCGAGLKNGTVANRCFTLSSAQKQWQESIPMIAP